MQSEIKTEWDPKVGVALPPPYSQAPEQPRAIVEFEHGHVLFAVARHHDGTAAFFVNGSGCWHRIPRADYEAAIVRCKADPTSQLIVCNRQSDDSKINFCFWPSDRCIDEYASCRLIEPHDEDEGVTVLTTQNLGYHRQTEVVA